MERGISGTDEAQLQSQLLRHLMRQHCSRLVDHLCVYAAHLHEIPWPADRSETESAFVGVAAEAVARCISQTDRSKLIDLLKQSGRQSDAAQTALALDKVFGLLRANTCSFDEFYSLIDSIASTNLGLSLTARLRNNKSDGKRKREEQAKANELAIQVESQLHDAAAAVKSNLADLAPVASVALSAACLFAQVVTGWPVSAPGKCVPDLVTWLTTVLESSKQQSADGQRDLPATALRNLVSSTAIADLSLITTTVTEEMHSEHPFIDDTTLSDACQRLSATAKICRKSLYS